MRTKMKTITATVLLVVMMATMLVPVVSAEFVGIAPTNASYKTLEVINGNGSEKYTGGPGTVSIVVSNYHVDVTGTANAGYYWSGRSYQAGSDTVRVEVTFYSNTTLTAPVYAYYIDVVFKTLIKV